MFVMYNYFLRPPKMIADHCYRRISKVKQVVPSVLTDDPKDFERKIRILEKLAEVIQVDIMDGEFVPNTSIGVSEVQRVNPRCRIEAHLMVKHPLKYIQSFARVGAFRIMAHVESDDKTREVINEIRQFNMEVGLALNPPTPVGKIKPFLDSLDAVLVMGVNPGFQGQEFITDILDKVRAVKDTHPEIIVEVDGGVNPDTGPALVEAGVDILNVGSYFFKGQSFEDNWNTMQKIASGDYNKG
jgi:ribulose-phosphate 3-epimerase